MKAIVKSYAPVGKNASFSVIIMGDHDTHKRVVPLQIKSKYQAELAAIKYVLQSVDPNQDIEIITSIAQIPNTLTKTKDGKWPKRKNKNELVDEIRGLADKFKSFSCIKDSGTKEMDQANQLVKLVNSI